MRKFGPLLRAFPSQTFFIKNRPNDHIVFNCILGSSIVTVRASDADAGDNGRVTYSLESQDGAGLFRIDPNSGVLTLRGILGTNNSNKIQTRAEISFHTLLVKYYNYLFGRQSSERGRDEVTFFYVGDLFCIHFGTKTKSSRIFLEKMPKHFFRNLRKDFFLKICILKFSAKVIQKGPQHRNT